MKDLKAKIKESISRLFKIHINVHDGMDAAGETAAEASSFDGPSQDGFLHGRMGRHRGEGGKEGRKRLLLRHNGTDGATPMFSL